MVVKRDFDARASLFLAAFSPRGSPSSAFRERGCQVA
jgi:hypothetical protein